LLIYSGIEDDPIAWWPASDILRAVEDHVRLWAVDTIVTFDEGGVSGHINHRAVSAALVSYALAPPSSPGGVVPTLWLSQTVPVLRKYSGLIDLPISALRFFASMVFGRTESRALEPLVPPYTAETETAARDSEKRRDERSARLGRVERGLLIGGWAEYKAARAAFWRHRTQ